MTSFWPTTIIVIIPLGIGATVSPQNFTSPVWIAIAIASAAYDITRAICVLATVYWKKK